MAHPFGISLLSDISSTPQEMIIAPRPILLGLGNDISSVPVVSNGYTAVSMSLIG
jgi:hypothetical protein